MQVLPLFAIALFYPSSNFSSEASGLINAVSFIFTVRQI
jgi:hypothetical protein